MLPGQFNRTKIGEKCQNQFCCQKVFLPFPMLTAKADAESRCSSSWMTRLFCRLCCNKLLAFSPRWWPLANCWGLMDEEPEPVEVVSEMDDPEEKGGRDRSEGDGDEGTAAVLSPLEPLLLLWIAPPRGLESSRYWGCWWELETADGGGCSLGEEKLAKAALVRRRGLNLGASLKGTEKERKQRLKRKLRSDKVYDRVRSQGGFIDRIRGHQMHFWIIHSTYSRCFFYSLQI